MGNCCLRCFGKIVKRKHLRTRYNVGRDNMSVEFDNLLDEEGSQQVDSTQYGAVLSEHERILVSERRFNDLVQYQLQVDAEIHVQLLEQEDQLRRDEEMFYEAKRQAARVASKSLGDKRVKSTTVTNHSRTSASTDEWELANGDEDFEQFLENVRIRSLNARTRVMTTQVVQIDTPGSEMDGV